MDLAGGAIGAEAKYDLKVEAGKITLKADYDGKGLDGGAYITLEGDYFMDKLAEAIPGKLDDAVIALLKAALKA